MCSQVRCRRCSKPTWSGCGAHIEQALANVPPDQRCRCRDEDQKGSTTAPPEKKRGLFGLF